MTPSFLTPTFIRRFLHGLVFSFFLGPRTRGQIRPDPERTTAVTEFSFFGKAGVVDYRLSEEVDLGSPLCHLATLGSARSRLMGKQDTWSCEEPKDIILSEHPAVAQRATCRMNFT